jgi:molybdate/tungstate transport system permease protein
MSASKVFAAAPTVCATLLVLFFALPVAAMVFAETPAALWRALCNREVASALWVSAAASSVSTAIALLFGVPAGYLLARRDFPAKALVGALVDMPVVIPHLVAGIALLTILAPKGLIGAPLGHLRLRFVDAMPGTVAAMLFVSAPFVVNSARSAFEAVDPKLEAASRILGASAARTFFSVSLPLAKGGIIAGAVMAWARAISEFGAVLVLAYYPRIAPTLIYERFTSTGLAGGRPAAVLLVILCLALFVALRLGVRRPVPLIGGGGRA